jgi:FAD/FMN-containing dehydrogenase
MRFAGAAKVLPWGGYPHFTQHVTSVAWLDELPDRVKTVSAAHGTTLPFGNGRSYGDSCLAASDRAIGMRGLCRIVSFDRSTGVLVSDAGLLLSDLLDVTLPCGWFPPVTPGTQFVTLGGAIANDVHGKNHHRRGTIGRYVRALQLFRSDGGWIHCSPGERPELFTATIGGLGLTGFICRVELQLMPVASGEIDAKTISFRNLDHFFELSARYDPLHEYSVAWVDCLASGGSLGRGLLMVGDHCGTPSPRRRARRSFTVPFTPPVSAVNRLTLRAFNAAYYHAHRGREARRRVDYERYFYPLDAIGQWNRLYGPRGFQQYQCVVPDTVASDAVRRLLGEISSHGAGSFLAVLKRCGPLTSPGLLSFPLPGVSLALDFPNAADLAVLFERLDRIVRESGGRLYPAKDAHVSGPDFRAAYPRWKEVETMRDPVIMSRFWRRVTSEG